jgi:hypothetical protein
MTSTTIGARVLVGLLTLSITISVANAAEIAGVKLEDKIRVGSQEVVLNGAGVRTRAFFKVYVGGLYLAEKKSAPAEVLALKGAKRVSMTLLRDLSAEQLSEALGDGVRNNHTEIEMEALKPRVDELLAIIKTIGAAKAGNLIALDFLPESGTRLSLNGEAKGNAIAGEDFYRALLKIWLGDKPVDSDLKKGMLGPMN